MNAIRTMLLATIAALAAPSQAAEADALEPEAPACVDAAVAAIQKRYESISDLQASFVQRSRTVALGGAGAAGRSEARGVVVFAKPGKMRWSYEAPEPSLVVSDGATLWLYDPVNAEVQRMSAAGGIASGAAIQFLLGQGDMRRDFAIEAVACGDGTAELELVPRVDAGYEKLRALADLPSGQLRRTTVFDLIGNVTEVVFSDVQTNQDPSDSTFRFEPPEGVKVIELDAP